MTHPTNSNASEGSPRALIPTWRDLNAFLHIDPAFDPTAAMTVAHRQQTSAATVGALSGMSLAIKDNIEVAGMPCTAGTPSLRRYVPFRDAAVVSHLRSAGAQLVGKTNLHELAYGITGKNAAFGAVRNAFLPTHIAGGSSSGTAVAIAAGVVRAGLGTDTGGSCRIPAALNGIVGFRPSPLRYPMAGVIRISTTRDVVGPMAATVEDVRLLDLVLSAGRIEPEPPIDLHGLRMGIPRQLFRENLHPDVERVFERSAATLRECGVVLVEDNLPDVAKLNHAVGFPIVLYETEPALRSFLADSRFNISLEELLEGIASPDVKALVTLAFNGHISQEAYHRALLTDRPALCRMYRDYFEAHRVDAILIPTTPLPACALEGNDSTVELNGVQVPTFSTFIRNTDPASNAGIPAISVPAGFSGDHLPIGVELEGPADGDRRLLRIAEAVENALQFKYQQ